MRKYLLSGIILFGFCLRATGIFRGLPYEYAPDEEYVMGAIFHYFLKGDLNPHWFGAPLSFVMYTVLPITILVLIYAMGIHFIQSHSLDIRAFTKLTQGEGPVKDLIFTGSVGMGRLLMVIYAALTIYFIYKILSSIGNKRAGIIAALLFALAPLHIIYSPIIRPDIPSALLITVSTYFLVQFLLKPSMTAISLAALFSGLSMSAKWTSGVSLLPVLIIAGMEDFKKPFLNLRALVSSGVFQSVIFFLLGFAVFAPFCVIKPLNAYNDFATELIRLHVGSDGHGFLANASWYWRESLTKGFGSVAIAAAAACGLALLLVQKSCTKKALLIFPVIFMVAIFAAKFRWTRWMIPVFPFEAIFAGVFIDFIIRRFKVIGFGAVLATCILMTELPVAHAGIKTATLNLTTSPTVQAKNWIEKNLPANASIAFEAYGPPLHVHKRDDLKLVSKGWDLIISWPLSVYKEQGVDYLAISSVLKRQYLSDVKNYRVPAKRYAEIEAECESVAVFRENGEPMVEIYRIK